MCTNLTIQRKSNDEALISARTMDFVQELPTKIQFVPRMQNFPQKPLQGEIRWKNKYGFIGVLHSVSGEVGYSDGLNEVGLSAASLWLDSGIYPKPVPGAPILSDHNVVSYILGNFKNVREAKEALSKVVVIDTELPFPTPLHYIISDASGHHLIVEFVNGVIKTYINTMGVLTNDPTYDWHLTNLCNYKNLSLTNNPSHCESGELYGSGQFGIPGDPSPHSRFIRSELLSRSTFHPENTQQSINLALQVIKTIAIPCGTLNVYAHDTKSSGPDYDWTQWIVIRDHTNCSFYFCSAFNSKLYGIQLNKLDFNYPNPNYIDIKLPKWCEDVTNFFLHPQN